MEGGAATRNQVRRLPDHGTAASHNAARRLAETLSGSVKGPKRVPLSFRDVPEETGQGPLGAKTGPAPPGIKAQQSGRDGVLDVGAVL